MSMELNFCEVKITFSLNEQNTVRYINIKLIIIRTQRHILALSNIDDGTFLRKYKRRKEI